MTDSKHTGITAKTWPTTLKVGAKRKCCVGNDIVGLNMVNRSTGATLGDIQLMMIIITYRDICHLKRLTGLRDGIFVN